MALSSYSQEVDSTSLPLVRKGEKNMSLLLGYNVWEKHLLEIGIARNQLDIVGPHPLGYSYFASTEVSLSKEPVIGPKLGFWWGGGIAMGLSTIFYTDFAQRAWRLRPEAGIGVDRFKLVYGYNIALSNSEFDKINSHTASLALLLKFNNNYNR